ncbi:CLUMA_CG011193, isoform A [Clunio marinus]|uniref:CLUMA_CG011193, isoform A n=1 Tax=Clunio marinus TaxID=568069 RepID=A0A1J1IHA3_9DIPT|nr:CLUMA_CG011193, isoform A [Clunio marinus]
MNSFVMFAVFALAAVANCEAPGGYNYNRPSSGGGFSAGGSSFGGGSGLGGGNYQQVAIGGNTYEGQQVDQQLLNNIRQILLQEESKASAGGSAGGFGGGFGGGAPSSSYGVPQQQYGVPAQQSRVVGIVLENTVPAIQVAQYRAQSQVAGGYSGGGYPSGPVGGVAPSSSYGAPARPSSSYGTPY